MLHEIIKYQNYCDALEKSIISQEKMEKEILEEQEVEESLSLDNDMLELSASPPDSNHMLSKPSLN